MFRFFPTLLFVAAFLLSACVSPAGHERASDQNDDTNGENDDRLCTAWDAEARGYCALELGTTFNGRTCSSLAGCNCVGSDCDLLVPTSNCRKLTGDCDNTCGDPDAIGCDGDFDNLDPTSCPDGTVYTVLDCEKEACVNPDTCEEVVVPD